MSKELIKPHQFASAQASWEDTSSVQDVAANQDLAALYEDAAATYKQGTIVEGTVVTKSADGVVVDINYKSTGLIPLYEFNSHELAKIEPGVKVEVFIEQIEDAKGNVVLSYEKAKAAKAWNRIIKLFQENKPVEGVVLHKVKGGLHVDVGVPAFLPGSQVDIQRVNDFDVYVGKTIHAYIIKVNQKRGNVIISRRKYLHDQRSDSRRKILDTLIVGQTVEGIVKNITNYGAFIDVGGVDGLMHITDMTWGRIAHPSQIVAIGDKIKVKILDFDKDTEKVSLGLKQLGANPWLELSDDIKVGSIVKGKISSITDYGLFIEINPGVEGLIHISEISWTERMTELQKHYKVGQEIEAIVVALDKDERRMSLSIRKMQENPWDVISRDYKVGQSVTGTVSNITNFGIFVQILPNIDGLVYIGDVSWTDHVKNLHEMYKKGDSVEAVITDIDLENKKISLSIKQLSENPWEKLEEKYPLNSSVTGEVSKITDYGAFVTLDSGIDGLVHISELSDQQVKNVNDVLKIGDKREFRVIKVNQEERRLGLSLRSSDDERPKRTKSEGGERRSAPRHQRREETAAPMKSALQLELEKHFGGGSDNKE